MILSDEALRMLSSVRTDACGLTNIAELDHERAARTANYARDCMEQVNELFTIMSGRLQYVSYILDELGESVWLTRHHSSSGATQLMNCWKPSTRLQRSTWEGHNPPIHLVLKAGQVIAKLERTFQRDELATIIGPTLVQRASSLLSDYTTMLRGFSPPGEVSEYNLIPIIKAHVTMLSVPVFSDEEVLRVRR